VGFLLAVLWFDLMHDVQVLRPSTAGDLDDAAVLSIARYYRRVTTDARPMNRLVALVMVATVAALVVEVAQGDVAAWAAWTSLVLTLAAVSLAAVRTVKNAVALGAEVDVDSFTPEHVAVARSIGGDHLFCLVALALVLTLQLAA
jgi:hypothetical protein